MTENFTWFVGGWCVATLTLTAYLVWLRRDGSEQSTERKLRDAQRALVQTKQDYAECNAERIRAVADCAREMEYRNRDRRQLGFAIDMINEVREYCVAAGDATSGQTVLDIIEGRVHD